MRTFAIIYDGAAGRSRHEIEATHIEITPSGDLLLIDNGGIAKAYARGEWAHVFRVEEG